MIMDAVVYPFRGHGVFLIFIGGLMLGAVEIVSHYNMYFVFSVLFMVFDLGYLANYMFKIVEHTIQGENNLPTWPDFSDFWNSCIVPFFQMMVIFTTCLLPALVPLLSFGFTPLGIICSIVGFLLGCFYMPMALLAVSLNGSISALRSRVVWPAIRSVLGPYLVTYIALVVMGGLSALIQGVMTENMPLLVYFLNSVISTFFIAMEMRLVGLLYVRHRDTIDLF
jgi:hypothetical protein